MVEPLHLDNVIVSVPDVAAAAAWYQDRVGLTAVLVTDAIAVLHTRDRGPGLCLKHSLTATGGATVWFEVADARALAAEFSATPQRIRTGWVIEFQDPWGNTIGLTDYQEHP
ncbi:VOC family protein [Buchananella hordeovulneris]|uniref:VOC family protein n=1 Tax=Buchananella hordeovulneris TaxID=52770 RepID=UPI000F601060|nr:VOC family protein [Buchananella hordeovulneris]RRD42026.1 VOC family protein [Buchananella hordeovulneris]RRD53333.1 VOC family protein [Buchananella hordeovulneris]